ncbi:TPA: hypothetical protein HA244_00810 [Candidatus Micrarchaeota archaeon]|nr:hypothetical protein [Candidatus Micrarchaeota archaeon]
MARTKKFRRATNHVIEALSRLHEEKAKELEQRRGRPARQTTIDYGELSESLEPNKHFERYVQEVSEEPLSEAEEAGIAQLVDMIREADNIKAKEQGAVAFRRPFEQTASKIKEGWLRRKALNGVINYLISIKYLSPKQPEDKIKITAKQAEALRLLPGIRKSIGLGTR